MAAEISKVASSILTSAQMCENEKYELHTIRHVGSREHQAQMGTKRRMPDPKLLGDLFVLCTAYQQLDDVCLPAGNAESVKHIAPFLVADAKSRGVNAVRVGRSAAAQGIPQTERRTKVAPGAPGKGHGERAKADAPFGGAGTQGTASPIKLAGFPGSSVLTLARQFKFCPPLCDGVAIIIRGTGSPADRVRMRIRT